MQFSAAPSPGPVTPTLRWGQVSLVHTTVGEHVLDDGDSLCHERHCYGQNNTTGRLEKERGRVAKAKNLE